MKRTPFVLLILSIVVGLGAVLWPREHPPTLRVFAASSLTESFEALGDAFEAENPNVRVTFNFSGSSTLAAQLIQGAPGDVFASANAAQMASVQASGRLGAPPDVFALNQLILVTPVANPAAITTLADLARPGVRLVLAAPGVPVRGYTDTLLDCAKHKLTPPLEVDVGANIVSEEPNVRQVAAKVSLGEADAGFVYATDLTQAMRQITLPTGLAVEASYLIGALQDGNQTGPAQDFVAFVQSDVGQRILHSFGFSTVTDQPAGSTCADITSPLTLTGSP